MQPRLIPDAEQELRDGYWRIALAFGVDVCFWAIELHTVNSVNTR